MMNLDEAIQHCEKERLIRKNMLSIENRVRRAFNQGYEMGLKAYKEKLNCTDCIIDGTDACSRGAGRAVDVERCGDFVPSRSENPNTCGDAISKEQLIREINAQMAVGAITREIALDMLNHLLPVTPQQKMGRWIKTIGENGITSAVRCSECGFEDNRYMLFRYCPNCGAKMEVEE